MLTAVDFTKILAAETLVVVSVEVSVSAGAVSAGIVSSITGFAAVSVCSGAAVILMSFLSVFLLLAGL